MKLVLLILFFFLYTYLFLLTNTKTILAKHLGFKNTHVQIIWTLTESFEIYNQFYRVLYRNLMKILNKKRHTNKLLDTHFICREIYWNSGTLKRF